MKICKNERKIMIDINKEAEKYGFDKNGILSEQGQALIAGHNSKATQAKVIQGQIDLLNSLDGKLQAKIELIKTMISEQNEAGVSIDYSSRLNEKISGVRLAKEEIRRDLKELQQQLKELENEQT
jgi:prefoldin subunit 5